jgi:hypothetical protein
VAPGPTVVIGRAGRVAVGSVLLGLLLAGLAATGANASCPNLTAEELFDRADAVFTGQIAADVSRGRKRTITLAVDRVYRGQVLQQQAVATEVGEYGLGDAVRGDGRFLILGRYGGGVVVADVCGGSRGGGAPASFGAGYPPLAGASPETHPARWPTWVSLGVAATLGLTGLGLLLQRLVRRR